MTSPGTVYGYARVSREDQELALQLDALAAAGVAPGNIVAEKISGAKKRPAFEALRAKLKAGDSLVAWKVDRLGRNAIEALQVAEDLGARGVRIVILTLGLDSNTPTGRMVFGIMAQLAQFEREQLIERTKAGIEAARRRDVRFGRPPALTPHQKRQAAAMADEGRSYAEIGEIMGVDRSVAWRGAREARGRAAVKAEAA